MTAPRTRYVIWALVGGVAALLGGASRFVLHRSYSDVTTQDSVNARISPTQGNEDVRPQRRPATDGAPQLPIAVREDAFKLGQVLEEIATLEDRSAELLQGSIGCDQVGGRCTEWYAPSQSKLDEWARCAQLPVDIPPALLGGSREWFSESALASAGVTDEEREELSRVTAELESHYHTRFSVLHEKLIGSGNQEQLPTRVLLSQLRAVQIVVDEDGEIRRQIARLRAGQLTAADVVDDEIVDYYRELVDVGKHVESRLGTVVGAKRARQIRESGGGWGGRISNAPNCKDP